MEKNYSAASANVATTQKKVADVIQTVDKKDSAGSEIVDKSAFFA